MTNHCLIDPGAWITHEPIEVEAALAGGTRLASDTDSPGRAWCRPTDVVRGPDWPRAEPRDDHGFSPFRILVPFNGTAAARAALDVAFEMARGRPATAWVLYVRHWDLDRGGNRFCYETADEARQCAQSGVAVLRRRGVPASGVIRDAPRERVSHAIVVEAEHLNVGCIVLGTHAHGTFVACLTGSVPRKVARTATRPIIRVTAPRNPRRNRPL